MKTDSKFTILIVDDEKANLTVLNRILYGEYEIVMAKNGELALSLAMEGKPDLILLDIMLPDINGFDVLTRLKGEPETKKIPVICITGLDSEYDEEKGFLLGAVDYIKKPFKSAIVKARVHNHAEIVRQMRIIEKYSLTDPLTDLSNRRNFNDRLDTEWRRAVREHVPLSFLMMDLDKFKSYNDAYGHPQGDILLKAAAGVFMTMARRPADLPARLGGEEFGVLMPETGAEGALMVAEHIRAGIEALRVPTADGEVTTATISIGVVSAVPGKTDSIEDFISRADENLYAAKTAGRNRVYAGIPADPKDSQ
ncbi:MAG: diguanylate cyclase [Treponema sp.]|jgi:diguanylate cyclase (GGDEF)-like protein|nr:diguanylate cyclase [Treponema sp.]